MVWSESGEKSAQNKYQPNSKYIFWCNLRGKQEMDLFKFIFGSYITLQPKTGHPRKLSRVELVSTWMETPGKTRLLLEEVLVRPAGGAHPVLCVGPNTRVSWRRHYTVNKHHPSDETLNRGPDSLWTLKISGCLSRRVEVWPRHPGPIPPLASDHHDLLIIPIHWLASSLCLLSTCKLVWGGGRSGALWLPSHPSGGCTLVVDEKIPLMM